MKQRVSVLFMVILLTLGFARAATVDDELAAARSARDRGQITEAVQHYQQALQIDPNNVAALGEITDVLDNDGRWRDAVPFLERYVALQAHDAARLNQLGRYKSWLPDGTASALPLLREAAELAPTNSQYAFDYADTLARQTESRDEALERLRALVARDPRFVPAIVRLAQMLSWTDAGRTEAARLYEQGLAVDPSNLELLDGYAEMLSWQRATRPKAEELFDRALTIQPGDPRALVGKAQLLAWSGRSDEALALYDTVLRANPRHPLALRGKAEILNWKGKNEEARDLLLRARNETPDDPRITLELARAESGLGHYSNARILLDQISGNTDGFRETHELIERARGTWVEIGYAGRWNRHNLDFNRPLLRVSTPLNDQNRLSFGFQPTLYSSKNGDFSSNYYLLALDSRPLEDLTAHAQVGVEQYPGIADEVDGSLSFSYRVHPEWAIAGGFERASVEDSLLSTRGIDLAGFTLGQARSNLATVGFTHANHHHWDVSLFYSDGVYTARQIDSNRRWGLDLNLGKMVRSDKPYIRLSYGVSYMSFDHDVDFDPGTAPPQLVGGYFSPTRFLLNYGGINLSQRWTSKVEWEAYGTAGGQNVETTFAQFGNVQFADTAGTRLLWRVTGRDELRFSYEFLNVYNAFHRHLVGASWRHYF